jgi:hypothetical protein
MAAKLPYMASYGLVPKILTKIQEARRPERFTQDFVETKLGFSGGGAMAFIPLLKRMGFIASDGTPSRLYDKFRNVATQGAAVAAGMRAAYSELFDRNVYAGELSKDKLEALIMEVTGDAHEDRTTQLTVSTFLALQKLADFEAKLDDGAAAEPSEGSASTQPQVPVAPATHAHSGSVGLNLAYTINIVLPETTNAEVFNAIFKSLRDNLLSRS